MKRGLEQAKKDNYDLGFDNAKRFADRVIRKARQAGYLVGWEVALNVINLLLNSLYRDLSRVPLPEDLPVEKEPLGGQVGAKEDSPNFRELLEEIEAHTSNADVVDVENPSPPGTIQPPVASVGSEAIEATLNHAFFCHRAEPQCLSGVDYKLYFSFLFSSYFFFLYSSNLFNRTICHLIYLHVV